MMPVTSGETIGRLSNETTGRHTDHTSKPERMPHYLELLAYLVCAGAGMTVLVAATLFIVYQNDRGMDTLSLCITEECKLFAEQGCLQGEDQMAKLRYELLPEMGVHWPNVKGETDPVRRVVDLSVEWQMPTLLHIRTDDFVQLTEDRSPVFDTVTMDWWHPVFRRLHERGQYGSYVRAFYGAFSDDRNETAISFVVDTLTRCDLFLLEHKGAWHTYRDGILDKYQLKELQRRHMPGLSVHRWVDAINAKWSFRVTPETIVYVIDPVAMESMALFLSNFTWLESSLLIGWYVIQKLAPSVSPYFRQLLVHAFENDTGTLVSVQTGRCMEILIDLMGIVPFWPEIHYRIVEQTRDMVDTLMYSISAAIQRSINESDWMDTETRDIALTQLTKVKVVLGTPREAETERILTMLYADVPAVTSDFLASWRNTLEAMRPHLILADGYADVYCYNPLWHGVRFNYDTDTLLISVRDMFMPYFHFSAPKAVNVAGLGALITRGFMQIFDPYGPEESLQKWSEASRKAYSNVHRCLSSAYGSSWAAPMQRRQFGDLAPMRSLYRTFRPWQTKERQLAGLREFDPQQTFFIAFCHAHCVNNPKDQAARDRCNVPLRNLVEFSFVFKCPLGSPMNPPHKCNIW
ncbi:hypothetical protein MTO96_004502 [Rhipicephalus appendiculatus]